MTKKYLIITEFVSWEGRHLVLTLLASKQIYNLKCTAVQLLKYQILFAVINSGFKTIKNKIFRILLLSFFIQYDIL